MPGICSIKANYFKKCITANRNDCGQKLGGIDILGIWRRRNQRRI